MRFVGCARVVRKFPYEYELVLDEDASRRLRSVLYNKKVVVRVILDDGEVTINTVVGIISGGFNPPRLVVSARARDYPVLGRYEHRRVPVIITLDGQA